MLRFSEFRIAETFTLQEMQISENSKITPWLNSFCMDTLWKDDCLGPKKIIILFWCPRSSQNIDPKTIKVWKMSFMFCNRYGYHIREMPFMFFDRYWSHLQDFGDLIRRFFGIFRCPSFPKMSTFCKSRMLRYENNWRCFQNYLVFGVAFLHEKEINRCSFYSILEVPKMIQQVLKYVRESKLAILE